MKSIRKKQMVVLLLVTVVIAAGILQYNYNKNNLSSGVTGDNLDSDFVSGDVQVRDADQVSNQESGASIEANKLYFTESIKVLHSSHSS
jgi:hypothetical protein